MGQRIIATKESVYEGLLGIILEIRDGDDRDTHNETPDVYCAFDIPQSETVRETIERRFNAHAFGEHRP